MITIIFASVFEVRYPKATRAVSYQIISHPINVGDFMPASSSTYIYIYTLQLIRVGFQTQ